jgi:hypothetical protein
MNEESGMGRNPFNRSGKNGPEPDPAVRKDQVMKLLNLWMRMEHALDKLDPDEQRSSPEFERAKAQLHAAERASTKAELRAASEAARRHGF